MFRLRPQAAKMSRVHSSSAAIVSGNVASKANPILMAERSDPVDDADSGWQFWGGENDSLRAEDAQVWSVGEVLQLEPTLTAYIDSPKGTKLERASENASWSKS